MEGKHALHYTFGINVREKKLKLKIKVFNSSILILGI